MSIVEEVNLWRSRHSEPPKCDSVALNRLLPNNLESLRLKKRTCLRTGYALRGANMMIAMPSKATPEPKRSQAVGLMPSTAHSQRMAMKIYTPP
jgi:hypothetical protein